MYNLLGTYTFATLPPSISVVDGTQAFTSDMGMVYSKGSIWLPVNAGTTALQALRTANIAAYAQGPAIPAPLWVTLTAYVVGNVVTITGGQHLVCTVSGTSAAGMPAYTAAVLTGRPLVDGTVTWYGLPFVKSTTDVGAPVVTTGASAAALGLTETKFIGTSTILAQAVAGSIGAVAVNHLGGTSLGRYVFTNGPAAGSGNATTFAVTDGGQSASFVYSNNSCDLEFYITDSKFGITLSNSTTPVVVEIDGQLIQGNPAPAAGVAWCIAFDYSGIVKRRRVRIADNSAIDALRGYATTTLGFIESTDSPLTDTLLILGDSINNTVVPSAISGNGLGGPMGWWIGKLLGMTGVVNASIGGSGYVSANANSFTTLQCVLAAPNQTLFKNYAPSHVLIDSGFNDRAQPFTSVGPAALLTWQAVRALLPNAKITITDGFAEASGPDANALAQAANLLALFTQWNDGQSRFIQSIGPSTATAWTQGTNNAGSALQLGNACNYVGTDGTHPTPAGAYYLATRMAAAIKTAWNNAY